MFILADTAMIRQTTDSGLGKYADPHKEPPARANHHSTTAHKTNDPAITFCAIYSAFSERENVAINVNNTADKPHSASARCSMKTGSTPAM